MQNTKGADEVSYGNHRVLRLVLDPDTHAKLMEHARKEGVSVGVVVQVALKRQLGLFPKR